MGVYDSCAQDIVGTEPSGIRLRVTLAAVQKGRLQTLSSVIKSRKFDSTRKIKATKRSRKVYYLYAITVAYGIIFLGVGSLRCLS